MAWIFVTCSTATVSDFVGFFCTCTVLMSLDNGASIDNSLNSASRLKTRRYYQGFLHPLAKARIDSLPRAIAFWKVICQGAPLRAIQTIPLRMVRLQDGRPFSNFHKLQFDSILHLLIQRLNIINPLFSLFYHEKGVICFVQLFFSNTL